MDKNQNQNDGFWTWKPNGLLNQNTFINSNSNGGSTNNNNNNDNDNINNNINNKVPITEEAIERVSGGTKLGVTPLPTKTILTSSIENASRIAAPHKGDVLYPSSNSNLHQLDKKRNLFKLAAGNGNSGNLPTPLIGISEIPIPDMQGVLHRVAPNGKSVGFQPFQYQNTCSMSLNHHHNSAAATENTNPGTKSEQPNFESVIRYEPISNPRRVLTKPSKPGGNNGIDNQEGDYLLFVNDILGTTEGHQYQIIDSLGSGTFGQVVKAQNIKSKEMIALKIIKNKPAYYNQSLIEVAILEMIKKTYDVNGKHHLVRIKDHFIFKQHLCIGFEILSVNLYELIKQNQFRGLSTNLIRVFVTQILDALTVLSKAKIIHCDLKPENILLKSLESPSVKVIDLGSACHENQTVYTYIQSRFYRSPEVLLGLPYTCSIDMWSLGCIAAELFLGLPLFPGSSEYNQMSRYRNPPNHMCGKGKNGANLFTKTMGENGKAVYTLKTMQEYANERKTKEQPSKRYFQGTTLAEIVNSYPLMRKGLSAKDHSVEMQNRRSFIDFLAGMLRLNPLERWTPQQALQHPFITQKPFVEPWVPLLQTSRRSKSNGSSVDTRKLMPQGVGGDVQGGIVLGQDKPDSGSPAINIGTLGASGNTNTNAGQSTGTSGRQQQQQGVSMFNNGNEQAVVDSRYSQIVGTFSEFQINTSHKQQQQQNLGVQQQQLREQQLREQQLREQHYREQPKQQQRMQQQTGQYSILPDAIIAFSASATSHSNFSNHNQSRSMDQMKHGFPLRKTKSQYSVDGFLRPSLMQQQWTSTPGLQHGVLNETGTSFVEGHPRHGDQGERVRIPSRIPSVAASVDWELFEGGASVPNSYASSFQGGSMSSDVSFDGGMGNGVGNSRRATQLFASPNSSRHFSFQSRRMGSFSNESFDAYVASSGLQSQGGMMQSQSQGASISSLGKLNSEQQQLQQQQLQGTRDLNFLQRSPNISSSTHSKTHKKVKSTSSLQLGRAANNAAELFMAQSSQDEGDNSTRSNGANSAGEFVASQPINIQEGAGRIGPK